MSYLQWRWQKPSRTQPFRTLGTSVRPSWWLHLHWRQPRWENENFKTISTIETLINWFLDSGIIWNKESLDTYLKDPKKMIPGKCLSINVLRHFNLTRQVFKWSLNSNNIKEPRWFSLAWKRKETVKISLPSLNRTSKSLSKIQSCQSQYFRIFNFSVKPDFSAGSSPRKESYLLSPGRPCVRLRNLFRLFVYWN